jgi:hypothetical protein
MKHFFTKLRFFLVASIWLLCPLLSRAQSWRSAFSLPATGSSNVQDMVADGAGGYVLTGNFSGTLTLGSFNLTSGTDGDIFIARLNAAGIWTQAVSAGGIGNRSVRALALDASGNAVIAGDFSSPSITIGSFTLTNASINSPQYTDIFVARLNAAGQWTQAVRAGGPYLDSAHDLALAANGTATLVGSFTGGTVAFGTQTLTGSSTQALFVARLTMAGTWSQAVGIVSGGSPNSATGVALDATGNAVVCGSFFGVGTVKFGNITLLTYATATAFVARLNTAGIWTQAAQATNTQGFAAAGKVAIDANNNVVIAGNFRDAAVSFGSYTLPYTPSRDNLFVARLSSTGVWTQAAQASDSGSSFPQSIALDNTGAAWVTGQFRSPIISFGNTTLTNAGITPSPGSQVFSTDIFLARLSATNSWTYAAKAGGLDDDYPVKVVVAGDNVLIAGGFGPAPANFGSLTLTAASNTTGFIARLGSTMLSTTQAAGSSPLNLSPNPATTSTLLTLPAGTVPRLVQVCDMLGRTIRSQIIAAHVSSATIDISGLKPGIYLVSCDLKTQRMVVE